MNQQQPTIRFNDYARFLIHYLRPRLRLVLVLGTTLLASIGLQLVNPQILRAFIDTAQAGGAASQLTRMALLFIGVAVVQQLIGVLVVYVTENLGWATTNALRIELARHCLGLDMSFHAAHTPGEMIERIDGDVMALSNFFSQFILQVFGNILLVVGILLVLLREEWRVSASLAFFVAITVAVLLRLANISVSSWEAERQASASLFGFLEERLSGTEDIRSNNGKHYVLDRFYRLTRDLMRKTVKAGLKLNILLNTTWVLFAFGNAVAFLVSAALFKANAITLGTVYMILYYTNMLNWPLERITQQMQDLQKASASLVRIILIQRTTGRIAGEGDFASPAQTVCGSGPLAVAFDHVQFGYSDSTSSASAGGTGPQQDIVLHNVSFRLAPGRVLGLLGRTGSGKSTLTRLLFRLYDPDQGCVRMGSESGLQDIREVPLQELRRGVGMVTQNIQLFHASVRENLTFFDASIPDETILEAIRDLGLWEWYLSLHSGLDTDLESGGGGLSAGEAQMLAIAAIVVGLALARGVLIFGDIYAHFPYGFRTGALMRVSMLTRILDRPGAKAVPGSPGEAISRFRDDVNNAADFTAQIPFLIGQTLFAIVALVIMLRVSVRVTLMAYLPFVVVVLVANRAMKNVEKYRDANRKAAGRVTDFIGEIFGSAQAVKVATAETNVLERFNQLNESRRKAAITDRLYMAFVESAVWNFVNVITGVILLLVAQSLSTSAPGGPTMTLGDFALFIYYLGFVTEFTATTGVLIAWYKQAGVALARMITLLQGTPPMSLVKHTPVYVTGELPPVPSSDGRAPEDRDRMPEPQKGRDRCLQIDWVSCRTAFSSKETLLPQAMAPRAEGAWQARDAEVTVESGPRGLEIYLAAPEGPVRRIILRWRLSRAFGLALPRRSLGTRLRRSGVAGHRPRACDALVRSGLRRRDHRRIRGRLPVRTRWLSGRSIPAA